DPEDRRRDRVDLRLEVRRQLAADLPLEVVESGPHAAGVERARQQRQRGPRGRDQRARRIEGAHRQRPRGGPDDAREEEHQSAEREDAPGDVLRALEVAKDALRPRRRRLPRHGHRYWYPRMSWKTFVSDSLRPSKTSPPVASATWWSSAGSASPNSTGNVLTSCTVLPSALRSSRNCPTSSPELFSPSVISTTEVSRVGSAWRSAAASWYARSSAL